ncbi:MAG TPA: hypothetical protein VK971_10915 [Thiohalobacter sp.]|nr:hypothetical protein [Thiohalobacter sp.]
MGLLKLIVLIPVAIVAVIAIAFAFYEGRKAYWDYRIRVMCEDDGGVTIFDNVAVTDEHVSSLPRVDGLLGVAPENLAKASEPVFSRIDRTSIRDGEPSVIRYEQKIIRRNDGEIIATAVMYARSGGDIPSMAFPSSYYCPDQREINREINQIFRIEEGLK